MFNIEQYYGKPSEPLPVEKAMLCNPHWGESYGYTHNCQRCVWVYELRRRGYDVIAKPKNARSASKDPVDELHEVRSVIKGGSWIKIPSDDRYNFIRSTLAKTGASRWIIWAKAEVNWHLFCVELLPSYLFGSGSLVWIEPQQNRRMDSNYLHDFRRTGMRMMRIDDKEFTYLIKWVGEKVEK